MVFDPFWSENGYPDFDNYGLKSGRVFGAGNIYESLPTYFSSQYVTGTTN